MLGELSSKYESNGNIGCISDGYGDPGGKSYGEYQLSSNAGSLQAFVNWCQSQGYWFGDKLASHELCSDDFDQAWRDLAEQHQGEFGQAQHDYIKYAYYDPAVQTLAENYFHIENHAEVMKDVVWSRAVQYGPGNILDMFTEACQTMYNANAEDYSGYPNLSYIDAQQFDYDFIVAVYKVCKTPEWNSTSLRESLNLRFDSECQDALARL